MGRVVKAEWGYSITLVFDQKSPVHIVSDFRVRGDELYRQTHTGRRTLYLIYKISSKMFICNFVIRFTRANLVNISFSLN